MQEHPVSCLWKNGTDSNKAHTGKSFCKGSCGKNMGACVLWLHLQPTCLAVSPPLKPRRLEVCSLAAVFTSYFLFPRYHLKDVIVGKIYFLLVRIKIKHMEIDIIKRETTGTGPNVYHENDTIAKYEIMDGAPVRGEHPGTQPAAASPIPLGPAEF